MTRGSNSRSSHMWGCIFQCREVFVRDVNVGMDVEKRVLVALVVMVKTER